MTQYFDFVALGWVEKYLREEMDAAQGHLRTFEREPGEIKHLREALRNVHSATGVLRLCTLDPAALLTEEIERVVTQLIDGSISGEARRLAMTELVAAIEALPAYLANVRAKREVSAGIIANVINDLRHFGNRPPMPDSLFFSPTLKPGAGISRGQLPAEDDKLKQFAIRATHVCHKYSKPALQRNREALKRLYAVGKHATPMLAGSPMEPYFRCYMGLIEALAQPYTTGDEVIRDVFKHTFIFLKALARQGIRACDEVNPTPYIKKMLYYIAKSPSPTVLQQNLRDTFGVQNVDDVRFESAGRLIQEDDLLEALNHTMSQLLEVMEFITSKHREICAGNTALHTTILPRLRQVGLQLKALGLNTHADTIGSQHAALEVLANRDTPATQSELLEFGGAMVAVKESLEHKLKHGLTAHGDSMGHELDVAIMAQTARCLGDMKSSINKQLSRQDLLELIDNVQAQTPVSAALLRPLHRAAALVNDEVLQQKVAGWDHENVPATQQVLQTAAELLAGLPEQAYAERAASDVEQVMSVLALMEDKKRESAILGNCVRYIRDSMELGGLVNDAGMACFAESIAALEHYMERRTEDPLGNSDEHLDRAEARSQMLASFIQQRVISVPVEEDILEMEGPDVAAETVADLDLEDVETSEVFETAEVDQPEPAPEPVETGKPARRSNVFELLPPAGRKFGKPAAETSDGSTGTPWRDALSLWRVAEIERGADAPLEDPSVDIDEELVDIFVEEGRKYVRKLEDAAPRFANSLGDEQIILDIRAIFHTLKGSARTIELNELGAFMFDMEKVFNALRDGYIKGTPEIAELLDTVAARMPDLVDDIDKRIPLYTADFHIPHSIAAAIAEKRFDPESMLVDVGTLVGARDVAVESEAPAAESDAPDADAESETGAAAPEEVAEQVDIWSLVEVQAILNAIDESLSAATKQGDSGHLRERSSQLMSALIPALLEMQAGRFLTLSDETVGYFIDLSVLEQLASNSVFGLIDNGRGEFFKFPLSDSVTSGLKAYMDSLSESDQEAEGVARMHTEVEAFLRRALRLPALPTNEAAENSVAATGSATDKGVPPSPKPATDPQPGFVLGGEGAGEESEAAEQASDMAPLIRELSQVASQDARDPATGAELSFAEEDTDPGLAADALAGPEVEEIELEVAAPDPQAAAEMTDDAAEDDDSPEDMEPEEEIDLELLDMFIETFEEYGEDIDAALTQLSRHDHGASQRLKNILHTMKGSANSIGLKNFGAMVHDFEGQIGDLEHAGDVTAPDAVRQLYVLADQLQNAAGFVRRSRSDWDESLAGDMPAPVVPDTVVEDQLADEPEAEAEVEPDADQLPGGAQPQRVDSMRVATNRIDRLLDTGIEISMSSVRARRALDAAIQDRAEVQMLARRVQDLVDKLSLQLDTEIQAKTEEMPAGEQFDPLEMDRITEKQSLAAVLREAAYDLHEESVELGMHIETAMREALSSSRLAESSHSEMRLLRLVSFSKLAPGFRRLVQQVSRQLKKKVDFQISCDEGGLDISVFEQVKTALEHMLRNAIDHGIDAPKERAKRGKTAAGKVTLNIHRRGTEFVIQLIDDGNGLNPEALRAKAIESGLISETDYLSDDEALRLIFQSGLSTAAKVTGISGRGVGMDVVYQSITQVGGIIEVQSKPGFFTQFDIRIPASISVNGALLASIGEEQVAVPLTSLEGSDFRQRDEVFQAALRDNGTIRFRDREYELRYLGVVRGTAPPPGIDAMPEFVPVLFASHERRRVAFYADAVTNAEELVIRSLGAQFTAVPGIAGGSLKPDGQPVLALDLNELIRQVDYADALSQSAKPSLESATLVLCVDDSVMMRRTYEKRLVSMGYEVITAIDGEAALDYLTEAKRLPDFIFTDLEMPNMNGFDFIAAMRRSPVLEQIPTVVVSSRDGEKHRAEAQRVGANDFMAKGANTAEGMRRMIEQYVTKTALAS